MRDFGERKILGINEIIREKKEEQVDKRYERGDRRGGEDEEED